MPTGQTRTGQDHPGVTPEPRPRIRGRCLRKRFYPGLDVSRLEAEEVRPTALLSSARGSAGRGIVSATERPGFHVKSPTDD